MTTIIGNTGCSDRPGTGRRIFPVFILLCSMLTAGLLPARAEAISPGQLCKAQTPPEETPRLAISPEQQCKALTLLEEAPGPATVRGRLHRVATVRGLGSEEP